MQSDFDVLLVEEARHIGFDKALVAECPFSMPPQRFIENARIALASRTERETLNAFHDAKRAIECQIDWIAWNLALAKPRKPGLGPKLNALHDIGADPPELLQKIIRQRNLLEHEYQTIDEGSATDAVDIASLFIRATKDLAPMRYADWEFWSPVARVGGFFTFAYEMTDPASATNDWVPDFCNASDSRMGVHYRIYRSLRQDREDPHLVASEDEVDANLEWLGEGTATKNDPDMFRGFVRAMVRHATMR